MDINEKKQKTVWIQVLFLTILFFGIFLRLWNLGYDSYWLDEGFTLIQSKGIVQHGYPLLDSGYTEWKDVLIPYLIAPFINFFGFGQAWILRLVSAIFGILSIIVGYRLAINMFSRQTAILFSFFLSVGYWYVAWSQQVRGYSALIFFVLLFFYFLSKYDKDKKSRYIIYAFVTIIFAVLAKKIAIILFISFLFYLLGKKEYKKFLIFILPSIVIGIFFVSSVGHVITNNNGGIHFYFYVKDYLFKYFGIFSILFWFGVVATFLTKKKLRALNGSIVLFMMISIIIFSVFIYVSEGRYLLMITPFLFLYSAYLLEYISNNFKYKFIVILILWVGVVSISGVYGQELIFIPQKHYDLEEHTPQPNYNEVYRRIIEKGFCEEDVIISTNSLMDMIYLGRADYAIPWSLTGKEGDTTFRENRDVYTGTSELKDNNKRFGLDKIKSLQKNKDIYVVVDALAYRRMDTKLRDSIIKEGVKLFETTDKYPVAVYLFSKK